MKRIQKILYTVFTVSIITTAGTNLNCSDKKSTPNNSKTSQTSQTVKQKPKLSVVTIRTGDEFKQIIDNNQDRLLVFDLYADWCMPCKLLSPMLEEVAGEESANASFYKINVDKLPAVAQAFQVQGIPYVVFIKNKQAVFAITGVHPKADYVNAISKFK